MRSLAIKKYNPMTDVLILLILLIMGLSVFVFIENFVEQPIINVSTASGECVDISINGGKFDCDFFNGEDKKKFDINYVQ